MKKKYFIGGTIVLFGILGGLGNPHVHASTSLPVYRLYNKNTGEHFYTKSLLEKNSLKAAGWKDEGLGWNSASSGQPIYRVYNPNVNGGDHYYTLSHYEAQSLVDKGWRWDNNGQAAFYSGGTVNLYVAYNPNASSGTHNYTISAFEQDSLLKGGWKYGAVAWKTVESSNNSSQTPTVEPTLKVKNSTVALGGKWTPIDNFVSATDRHGKSIDLSKVKISGNVNTNKSGSYTVTYSYDGVEEKAVIEVKLIVNVDVHCGGNAEEHRRYENRSMQQSIVSPTGVFLKKGQSITILSTDYKNLSVQLGQLGKYSYINGGKEITKQTVKLVQNKQQIVAENGDSEVWIINNSENAAKAMIEGGDKIPLFIKGKTTDAEFRQELKTYNQAPFIQISGDNAITNFQYPVVNNILQKVSITSFIDTLDKIVKYEYEVKGSQKDVVGTAHRYNDRILFETPDEGGGYAYATTGYVSFQKNTNAMVDLANAVINRDQWGVYHEVGHTFQDPYQKWNGMNGEVTNNIACEYILQKLGLPSGFADGTDRNTAVKNYMALPVEQRQIGTDNGIKLGLFQSLAVSFGEYFYPRLNQYYRELARFGQAEDNPQLFIKVASEISQYDLRPYFKEWGVNIEDETNKWLEQQNFKTLDKPIWEAIYNHTDDLSVDQVEPYTIPTVDVPKEKGEYILGSEKVPDYFNNGYSLPIASPITSTNGSSYPTTAVEGLTNGEAEMATTLTNQADVSNTVNISVKVKAGNAISLFGYQKTEERVVLTLQKDSSKLKVLPGDARTTIIDSGNGVGFEITHFSKDGKQLEDISVNKNQTPEVFVEQLNNVTYSDGDYFKVYSYHEGGIQSYIDSNIDLKQSDAKQVEYFRIENNKFVHFISPEVSNFKN